VHRDELTPALTRRKASRTIDIIFHGTLFRTAVFTLIRLSSNFHTFLWSARHFHGDDSLHLELQISVDKRAVHDAAPEFCARELAPRCCWPFAMKPPTQGCSAPLTTWDCLIPRYRQLTARQKSALSACRRLNRAPILTACKLAHKKRFTH